MVGKKLSALACCLFMVLSAGVASADLIYATSAGEDEVTLYSVDPESGVATKIGDTGYYRISAIDFDDEGTLYGVGERANGTSVLLKFDLATGKATEVGETGIVDTHVPGASCDPDTGFFYAYAEEGELYRISLTTGDGNFVGSPSDGGHSGNALCFGPDGTLYHARSGGLYIMDPEDASEFEDVTLTTDDLGPNDDLREVRGMDYAPELGTLYAAIKVDFDGEGTETHLCTIDERNGDVELLGASENLASLAVMVSHPIVNPRLKGRLRFNRAGRDSVSLKCELDLPGFVQQGETLAVNLAGVNQTFVFDVKGKSRVGGNVAKIKYRRKTNRWLLRVNLKRGSFAEAWRDNGAVPERRKGVPVEMLVQVTLGGRVFAQSVSCAYSAKPGKSGRFR